LEQQPKLSFQFFSEEIMPICQASKIFLLQWPIKSKLFDAENLTTNLKQLTRLASVLYLSY
jgi:hypothetical protein